MTVTLFCEIVNTSVRIQHSLERCCLNLPVGIFDISQWISFITKLLRCRVFTQQKHYGCCAEKRRAGPAIKSEFGARIVCYCEIITQLEPVFVQPAFVQIVQTTVLPEWR